jgi:hypothetical protein
MGAALIDVRLDVGPLPPSSSSQTVAGCLLGGFPVRRDQWGGERVVGGVYPALTLAPTCEAIRAPCQVFIDAGARLLCTSDGVCVISYV